MYGECGCFIGYILVLFNAVYVTSAFTKCYPVNGQRYCFYTNSLVGLMTRCLLLLEQTEYRFRLSIFPVFCIR